MTRQQPANDLRTSDNLKRIDDLESFRKELEGKAFDQRILQSLKDSHPIREELTRIVFEALRNKVIWIIIAGGAIIFTDLAIRAIPHFLSLFSGK